MAPASFATDFLLPEQLAWCSACQASKSCKQREKSLPTAPFLPSPALQIKVQAFKRTWLPTILWNRQERMWAGRHCQGWPPSSRQLVAAEDGSWGEALATRPAQSGLRATRVRTPQHSSEGLQQEPSVFFHSYVCSSLVKHITVLSRNGFVPNMVRARLPGALMRNRLSITVHAPGEKRWQAALDTFSPLRFKG